MVWMREDCPCCEYNKYANEKACDKNCLIKWMDRDCCSIEGEFSIWLFAKSLDDKRNAALAIVQLCDDALDKLGVGK